MKPSDRYKLKIAASALLGALTLASASTLAWAMGDVRAETPVTPWLSEVHERRARIAADHPEQYPLAAQESRAALAQAPLTAPAWVRLAQLRYQDHGMDAETIALLERSYSVAPYGPLVSYRRIRFIYGNWREVTPSLRRQAQDELTAFVSYRERGFSSQEIHDPTGRMTAEVAIRLAKSQRASRERAENALSTRQSER